VTEPKPDDEALPTTDKTADKATDDDGTPPTRSEALNRMRGLAPGLYQRSGEIAAESVALGTVTNINQFSGPITVAGDFTTGPTDGRRGSVRRTAKIQLDSDKLAAEFGFYARPVDFDFGVDKLDLGHLLVIADQARTGRGARARATSVEVLRRNNMTTNVVELDVTVLGNMAWRPPDRERAYLVRDRPDRHGKCAAQSLTEAWLSHASTQAREHESYLVVVTGPVGGSLATAPNLVEFVVTELDRPNPREIVRKRLAAETGWLTEAEADEQVAATELPDILTERDDPRFATRAAKMFAEALRNGDDLATVVARLRDPEEQVREWLSADPDPSDVAKVLATAGLEGCGYLSVTDAAVTLHRKLGGGGGPMTPRYLRELLAERSWIEIVQPEDGPRVVRFRHAALRAAVLALTWFELDGARPAIQEWLAGLAGHPDVEVRARAASTAGLLAARDLQHGLHQFFRPWGQHKSAILQQSAATGLNVAGSVSGRSDLFWQHVEEWAEQVRYDKRALPATAALAAGGSLGVEDPRRALRVLWTLVDEGDWDLLEPIAMSTHALLSAGRVAQVIEALLEWTESATVDESFVKALTMFTFAARGRGAAGTPAGDRPVLMLSMTAQRDALPELWGRALDCEPVRTLAAEALLVWVRVADADATVRGDVLDLLAGIADRGDQDYGRLCHLLEKWADDPDDPSAAAARFHHELVEEGALIS
jgi:hypothetical protein